MPPLRPSFWAFVPLMIVLLSGCQRPSIRDRNLPDPVLMSKAPIEGTASLEIPQPEIPLNPEPPRPPIHAWVSEEWAQPRATAKLQAPVVAPGPLSEVKAIEWKSNKPHSRSNHVPQKKNNRIAFTPSGRAKDYSWLRGVLQRSAFGEWQLRYTQEFAWDSWKGRVCLEPDERLDAFREGDVLYVQGEMIRENGRVQMDDSMLHPRYRIQRVIFLQHGKRERAKRPRRQEN